MNDRTILALFASFVGIAFALLWYYVGSSDVSGALYGIPGTDAMGPFAAALLLLWFLLVVAVSYLNRPFE